MIISDDLLSLNREQIGLGLNAIRCALEDSDALKELVSRETIRNQRGLLEYFRIWLTMYQQQWNAFSRNIQGRSKRFVKIIHKKTNKLEILKKSNGAPFFECFEEMI